MWKENSTANKKRGKTLENESFERSIPKQNIQVYFPRYPKEFPFKALRAGMGNKLRFISLISQCCEGSFSGILETRHKFSIVGKTANIVVLYKNAPKSRSKSRGLRGTLINMWVTLIAL
uniref:Uncharacterized protein n=1 Tax=Romanomermis culicivorax TaxID=13658 RepID=A0A915J422_ROMCU